MYRTTDIVLAACLLLNDYGLLGIEKEGNKGTFVFPDVEDEFIYDYGCGKIRVEPVALNYEIKRLTTSVRRMPNV